MFVPRCSDLCFLPRKRQKLTLDNQLVPGSEEAHGGLKGISNPPSGSAEVPGDTQGGKDIFFMDRSSEGYCFQNLASDRRPCTRICELSRRVWSGHPRFCEGLDPRRKLVEMKLFDSNLSVLLRRRNEMELGGGISTDGCFDGDAKPLFLSSSVVEPGGTPDSMN